MDKKQISKESQEILDLARDLQDIRRLSKKYGVQIQASAAEESLESKISTLFNNAARLINTVTHYGVQVLAVRSSDNILNEDLKPFLDETDDDKGNRITILSYKPHLYSRDIVKDRPMGDGSKISYEDDETYFKFILSCLDLR